MNVNSLLRRASRGFAELRANMLWRAPSPLVLVSAAAAGGLLFLAADLSAQAAPDTAKAPKPYNPPSIFGEANAIEFTLTAPFGKLKRDRAVATEYRPATITYMADGASVRVPVRLRTRGIWRKKNCEIPPLMMNFTNDSSKKTAFARLDRARFTYACRNNDDFEQYVLQEYQLYRVHRLLSPLSYDVRLARVTYVDSEKKDTLSTRWAFLSETDEAFVARQGVKLVTTQGAGPDDLDPYESAFYGVFQYFVGNSDFSIRALHNAVVILKEMQYYPVARDFDWSGAVNARYATPSPILKIRSVAERIMRGYCVPPEHYEKVFALFREKKDAIYALYRDPVVAAMRPNVVANTLKYFDEFYATINDPRRAKREIIDACLRGSA
jgi:hypothetical protein